MNSKFLEETEVNDLPSYKGGKAIHWDDLTAAAAEKKGKNIVLKAVFNHVQRRLQTVNDHARKTVQAQIDLAAAKKEICADPRRYEPLNKTSISLQAHIMKSQAALVFHCDEKIAHKIHGVRTATGNLLIEETRMADGRKSLGIWNEATQSRDIHAEIYSARDPETGAQAAAYYDVTNDRITINFGGTDFTNTKDLRSSMQATVGAIDMRMTCTKGFIDQAMASFATLYPGLFPDVPVDIYAHSMGATAIPLANYLLQAEYNIAPRAQVMMDPFGAKNSFESVARMAAAAEGSSYEQMFDKLTRNTLTYKVKGGTFIDRMEWIDAYNTTGPGNAAGTIGAVEVLGVKGHRGKEWIAFFNALEVERANLSPVVTNAARDAKAGSRKLRV